jgi:hypothetical protein
MDWQTVSFISGAVGNAIASIDKIYRGYADYLKTKKPNVFDQPPDLSYQNKPDESAFVATSRQTGQVYQKVTYKELESKLNESDRAYIDTLNSALSNLERQWSTTYEDWSVSAGMDRGRYESQLDMLAPRIADPLLRILKFIEQMGLPVRTPCSLSRCEGA